MVDNDLTPYIVVNAQLPNVYVPTDYIEDGRIILNISPFATENLEITNQFIEFEASFSGSVEQITAPISAVMAIYAKENGRGMVFNEDDEDDGGGDDFPPTPPEDSPSAKEGDMAKKGKRPKLHIVK